MNTPTDNEKRIAHIRKLKAAFDKARETGEPLNLKVGKHDAEFKKGKLKLDTRKNKK